MDKTPKKKIEIICQITHIQIFFKQNYFIWQLDRECNFFHSRSKTGAAGQFLKKELLVLQERIRYRYLDDCKPWKSNSQYLELAFLWRKVPWFNLVLVAINERWRATSQQITIFGISWVKKCKWDLETPCDS